MMLYNKELFQSVCNDMGLRLDQNSDYKAAKERMSSFYPFDEFCMSDYEQSITTLNYMCKEHSYRLILSNTFAEECKTFLISNDSLNIA